eukprot:256197-Rhodomonas_salina.1
MEEEKHQDILIDLLHALRRQTAPTLVVWVAAHIGDPWNELADMAANAGTGEEGCLWGLDTCPIALHSISTSTFPRLHEANWTPVTPTVDKHVRCPHLHGTQHTMHNAIARVLIQHLGETLEHQGPLPPSMKIHIAKRVDGIWQDCPADIADFVLDGVIITTKQDGGKHPSRVIVFEFAHSYTVTIKEDELITVGAAKRNQYQSLVQYLLPLFLQHTVCCLSYILSTLGVLPQDMWTKNCESVGYTAPQIFAQDRQVPDGRCPRVCYGWSPAQ